MKKDFDKWNSNAKRRKPAVKRVFSEAEAIISNDDIKRK